MKKESLKSDLSLPFFWQLCGLPFVFTSTLIWLHLLETNLFFNAENPFGYTVAFFFFSILSYVIFYVVWGLSGRFLRGFLRVYLALLGVIILMNWTINFICYRSGKNRFDVELVATHLRQGRPLPKPYRLIDQKEDIL